MDEYISVIFMNGENMIVMYNMCEDFLFAASFIFDLCFVVEFLTRVEVKCEGE